jgi:hypothetical protein
MELCSEPKDPGTRSGDGSQVTKRLAPLSVGDRLPWKIDEEGEPQWVVIIGAITPRSYLVRYPDRRTEILVDSE